MENQAPESVTDVLRLDFAVRDELQRAPVSRWLCLDYPAHGALAAASVCRQRAEQYHSQGSYGEAIVGQRMLKRADRFESMAIRLLEGLDRVDPLEYVFRRSWRWGNHHLISLAHHLECLSTSSDIAYIAYVK